MSILIKRSTLLLSLLFLAALVDAQTEYIRNNTEPAQEFIERIKPTDSPLIHPVIETNWNNTDKKIIIAFWETNIPYTIQNDEFVAAYAIGKMYVPTGNNNTYQEITIDTISENPLPTQVLSVFFDDADGDGIREMLVLCAWDYRHYQMSGTSYTAFVYDNMDYTCLPEHLTIIDTLDGGIDGNNDEDEQMTPMFTNTAGVKAFLNKRGRKPNKSYFNKSFTGTIGNDLNVKFNINASRHEIEGFYYYDRIGIDIPISGYIDDDLKATIYEMGNNGIRQASIDGIFTDSGFSGTWKSESTGKTYPIVLKSLDYMIQPLPAGLTGLYEPTEGCDMNMYISKDAEGYYYEMYITDRKEKGKILFSREYGKEQSNLSIIFSGLKWDEYPEGTINTSKTDVSGEWQDGNIVIQNYGNSMNNYIKIKECGNKYIILTKLPEDVTR